MKYLLIDSATATLVVAIVIDDKIAYYYNQKVGKDMSSSIMSVIDEAFKTVGIKPRELDKIFIANGPGSFTGIRVGLTVAKTMAWALNIPVISISSLEVIASTPSNQNNIAVIDARRGYVYAGVYDVNLNSIMSDQHILFNDINQQGTVVSYDSYGEIKPNIDILKVIKKHINDEAVNPHSLKPKYLKLTEAEEKLHKFHD